MTTAIENAIAIITDTINADRFNAEIIGLAAWLFVVKCIFRLRKALDEGKLSPAQAHDRMVMISKGKLDDHFITAELTYVALNCGLSHTRVLALAACAACTEIIDINRESKKVEKN